MKKGLVLLAMSSIALFGSCDIYDGQVSGDCKAAAETQVFVTNQTVVNNIIVDTPKTDLITQDKSFGASAQYINAGEVSMINIPLGINIGSNFGVETNIPVVSVKGFVNPNSFQKEDNFGLGDVSVGGNFHFGMITQEGLNITTLLYKTTTGDEDKGLGSGKDAVTLSHKFVKYVTDRATVNALLSYTLNDDAVSGNAYMAMIGGSMPCLLNDDIITNAKVTYFHTDEVSKNSIVTSPELKTADLWLNWDVNQYFNHIPVSFGVKIPLLNQIGSTDIDKTYLFYLSLSSFF